MNVACPQLDHEEDQIAFQSLQREDLDREQIGRGQPVPMRLEERFEDDTVCAGLALAQGPCRG